jgi:hypothetical protein
MPDSTAHVIMVKAPTTTLMLHVDPGDVVLVAQVAVDPEGQAYQLPMVDVVVDAGGCEVRIYRDDD